MEKKKKIIATFRTSEELWSKFTEKHGKNRTRELREFMKKDLECPSCKGSLEGQAKQAISNEYLKPIFYECPQCKVELTFIRDKENKKIKGVKIREPGDYPVF